jgi:hypothetical protein
MVHAILEVGASSQEPAARIPTVAWTTAQNIDH